MINIIENLIIPDDSVQKYLSLSAFENGEDWFGNGVVWAGASQLTAGHKVYRQCCEQHLVYFCLEGEVNYRCDDFVGVVKPGHMLFIPAGYEHHFQSDRVVSIWFMLDPRHSRWEWLRSLQAKASISISENELKNLCEIIYIEMFRQEKKSLEVVHKLCDLTLCLLERELQADIPTTQARNMAKLERLWIQVRQQLNYPWNIQDLATLASMSRSHFHAIVHEIYGVGPMDYVRNMRMDHAKSLLKYTDYKLQIIAENCGYQSPFSFSNVFKKTIGISPKQYRKQQTTKV